MVSIMLAVTLVTAIEIQNYFINFLQVLLCIFRFYVVMTTVKRAAFCDVTLCSLVDMFVIRIDDRGNKIF
jgi:hypothetical protein